MLKREGGRLEGYEELGPFITYHYKSLFLSSAGPQNDDILQHVPCSVTESMNSLLLREHTVEEVDKALESSGDIKAPKPDGMPTKKFKNFWHMVGPNIQK
jgi:hypothetical protein